MADLLDISGAGQDQAPSLTSAIDSFQLQNLSPSDIFSLGNTIPRTLGGIPEIGSRIPGLSKIPIPGLSQIDKVMGPLNQFRFGKSGTFETVHYANDLNAHHPKFKFLFKVGFYGFAGRDFYYYVHRCDKPKVRFVHQDINYYNFRSRIMTSVMYEPLSIQFLDEIGNSVNEFFVAYLKQHSGQGDGNYGIDKGWSTASSSIPYKNGYADTHDQKIIIEQVFANGTMSNRFTFTNPRIESFDFDELSHEDNSGSMASINFSYDALKCQTVYGSTIYSWGNVDLLKGGGTSGPPNAGGLSGTSLIGALSADGAGIVGSAIKSGTDAFSNLMGGSNILNTAASFVGGGVPAGISSMLSSNTSVGGMFSSAKDTLTQGIESTLGAITSGKNMLADTIQGLGSSQQAPSDLAGTEYI